MRIIEIVFPIFAVAGFGYLLAWRRVFSTADIKSLSRYVFLVAIPVLLFDTMATVSLPAQIDWAFMLSYYLVILFLFSLSLFLGRRLFGYGPRRMGAFAFGATYSNTILVGLPIIDSAFGAEGVLPLFMIVSIHSAVIFFLGILVAEQSDTGRGVLAASTGRTLRAVATNPIIFGLVFGLLANLFSVALPTPLATAVTLIRGSALPAALFVLGASLNQFQLGGHWLESGLMVLLKLVVQPLLVWLLAFYVFDVDPLWARVAVLVGAMPVGINAYIFAAQYEANLPQVATAILVSTTLSIATVSWLLHLFL